MIFNTVTLQNRAVVEGQSEPLNLLSDEYQARRTASRSYRVRCAPSPSGCDRILGEARVLPGGKPVLEKARFHRDADGAVTVGVSRQKVRWEWVRQDVTLAILCPCGRRVVFQVDDLPDVIDQADADGRTDIVLAAG
jgi:hypothetical protein